MEKELDPMSFYKFVQMRPKKLEGNFSVTNPSGLNQDLKSNKIVDNQGEFLVLTF